MEIRTTYLGFELKHPFMPGSSPLADDLDTVKRLEDAGAAAIVLRSLFEEQIVGEEMATHDAMEGHANSFAESLSFFPSPDEFTLGSNDYLEHVRKVKAAVDVPVIASLNGIQEGGWVRYATGIKEAGADALELNVYDVPTDPTVSAGQVEDRIVGLVKAVKQAADLPLAVKLSPYYSSLANLAKRITDAGADGLVLFNRFYQPDIDIQALEAAQTLKYSTSDDLLLRLRWLAILFDKAAPLAVSGGVHTRDDAVKAILAGASAVQVTAALLKNGPDHLKKMIESVEAWLRANNYESLAQARGSMSLERCPDPHAFERGNYQKILLSWSR